MTRRRFETTVGTSVPAVTAAEMADVDRVAVEDVGLVLLQMMENAGRTLASHVLDVADNSGEAVLVVAGGGGNGGGGLTCARHLANHEVPVEVVLDRAPERLEGAAERQYGILDEMGVPTAAGPAALDATDRASAIVDALVGYGLTGDLREPTRSLVATTNRRPAPTVSLDVPSGIDATTGDGLGESVQPDRTLTLALPKTGLEDREELLFLADIGIPQTVYDRLDVDYDPPFAEASWVELRSLGGDDYDDGGKAKRPQ